jgi:acyl phosphate:glycerol-3-phosphate acyltransferase
VRWKEASIDYVVAVIIGYLLGSIPVSLLVARRHGVDLYATGDGNPGAWNALEQLGARRAWPAFIGDAAKALVAGLIGVALDGFWCGYAAVAAAMLGHAFPAFAGLRGGKAVMTFVGGAFALSPLAAACALALCAAVSAAARSFAWGARAGVFAYPAIQLAFDPVERVWATGGLMCLIGALFGLARLSGRRGPSTSAADAPPTA